MNVKIIMDRTPTPHNKKLLTFLLGNVEAYRKNLRMSIITIPKKEHKALDRKITALPAAYVGTNIIIGYKDVMRAITIAYNKTTAQGDVDPVQAYWEKSITQGMENADGDSGRNENEDISKRFTAATKRRGDSYARRAPSKPGKGDGKMPSAPAPQRAPDIRPQRSNKAQTTTSGLMAANASSSDFMSQNDPMSASNIEKDPLMAAFWRNNEITPGT